MRFTAYRFRGLRHRGYAVECPCCGGTFSEFLPYLDKQNVLCPSCDSLERHRLLWLYLMNEMPIYSEHLKILHFAPEYILQKRLRRLKNLDYLSVDLFSPLAMQTGVDILNLPFDENSYDLILCSHVLAHVSDDRKALREMKRVLKTTGTLILLTGETPNGQTTTLEYENVNSAEERLKLYGRSDRFRIYGSDFAQRCEKEGFSVKLVKYAEQFPDEVRTQFGLSTKDTIYLCSKK